MTTPQSTVIHTSDAPKAIGPYSQALQVKGFIFTAGQVGLDPATGQLVEGGIEAQTRRVLDNLTAVLAAAGASLNHVVKTTVFMQDLGEFAAMNAVYAEYFTSPESLPARSTVQVAALPRGARVEIECVAVIG
jgi:2-iminobutanoate/2-iminopropanoate deaminase